MQEALLAELQHKLDNFQGLAEARVTMRTWIQLLQVRQRERADGISDMSVPLHLAFMGKPETGKTQAGKLIARSYYALDILTEGNLTRKDGAAFREEDILEQAQRETGNVWMITHVGEMSVSVLKRIMELLQWDNFAVIFAGTEAEIERMLYKLPMLRLKISHYFHFTDKQRQMPTEQPLETWEQNFADTLATVQEDFLSQQLPELPGNPVAVPVRKGISIDCRDGDALRAGARMDMTAYARNTLQVRLVYTRLQQEMEIDACVFLLHENELTTCDEDMIFFGYPALENGSVSVMPDTGYPECAFCLNKVPDGIQKLAVCFSIYGRNPAFHFSQAENPMLQIYQGNTQIAYLDLSHLQLERTLVALEFYRHKNSWKLRAVAGGYHDGLEQLCRRYGVEVE